MQFASMASLWFALSLPFIIAMYLLKKKYHDTEVSSHLLWQRVLQPLEANRPWQKLKRNLLMLLQLLAAALFVLALMQPLWWSEGNAPDHVVVVLDRSASTLQATESASGEETTILETLKKQALNDLQQYAANQVTILAIGEEPEILLSKSEQKSEWKAAIDNLTAHVGRSAYQETMSLAAALSHVEGTDARTIVYTDGRWTEPVSIVEWDKPPRFVQPDQEMLSEANISVMRFGVALNNQTDTVSASVVLRNGGMAVREAELLVYADDQLQEVKNIELTGNKDETVFFSGLPKADMYQIRMETDDTLSLDNQAYAFLSTSRETTAWMEGSHFFLEKALQLSGVDVLKSDISGADSSLVPLSNVDFVIREFTHDEENTSPTINEGESWFEDRPAWIFGSPTGELAALSHTRYRVTEHPVTQHVPLRDSYISHVYTEEPYWSGLDPIIQAGNETLVSAGRIGGHPKLQFHFRLQDSDLPLRSDFPLLVKNAVDWLTQGKMNQLGQSLPAGFIEAGFHTNTTQTMWIDEAGNAIDVEMSGDQDALLAPSEPGLYRLVEENEHGDTLQSRYLFVTMDASESHAGYERFETFMEQSQDVSTSTAADSTTRFPKSLLPWVAFFALLVILTEWGVYQRGPSV